MKEHTLEQARDYARGMNAFTTSRDIRQGNLISVLTVLAESDDHEAFKPVIDSYVRCLRHPLSKEDPMSFGNPLRSIKYLCLHLKDGFISERNENNPVVNAFRKIYGKHL